MPIFRVTLDGGDEQPERSCEVTVEAADKQKALAFAEEHNPGVKATKAERER